MAHKTEYANQKKKKTTATEKDVMWAEKNERRARWQNIKKNETKMKR